MISNTISLGDLYCCRYQGDQAVHFSGLPSTYIFALCIGKYCFYLLI